MNPTRRLLEGWVILGHPLAELARLVRIPGVKRAPDNIRSYLSRWFHGHHDPGTKQALAVEEGVYSTGLNPDDPRGLSEAVDAECEGSAAYRDREIPLLIAQRRQLPR